MTHCAPQSSGDPRSLVIGVLGGIAAGKSEVARAFAGDSGSVIEADALVHAELCAPDTLAWLRARFPGVVGADGRIDRARLAAVVFAEPGARLELERRVHPPVRREIARGLAAARARRAPVIVLDVPLLLENDAEHRLVAECDALVFVDADAKVRRERASAGRGWSAEEFARREALQAPLDLKRTRADYAIANAGDRSALQAQVARILEQLRARAPRT